MAAPTIEEFIERSKVNCIALAGVEAKRRWKKENIEHIKDTDELEAQAKKFLETGTGKALKNEILEGGEFYRALCSENAPNDPRVVSSYNKYIAGMTMPGEAPPVKSRHRKRSRRKKALNTRYQQLYEQYESFEFTEDTDKAILDAVSELITSYFSDIFIFVPQRLINSAYSEVVSNKTLGDFMHKMYVEASLTPRRIDNIINYYHKQYTCLNDFIRGFAADTVLAASDYAGSTVTGIRKEFMMRFCDAHPRLGQMYSAILSKFDRKALTEVITNGEEYKKAVEYMQTQVKLGESARELILREIPDNVIDLYPGARTMHRRFILHLGPTNSGKTYSSLEACKKAETGVYLAPLRLLAYEICEKFNIEGVPCNMKTGEEEINVPFASHTASTVEMLNTNEHYDVAVVDECQLIEDEERGGAWTAAILGLMADEIHLCASENAKKILISLIELCGDSYEIVMHERSVPLVFDSRRFTFPRSVEPKDALIVFTKKSVLRYAEELKRYGIRASVIYGDLPYDVRRSEVSRFIKGETDVVVATDAVGMGLNLPIRRVVFLEAYKYDGRRRRFLRASEIKQIAGRAGRMGMFDTGYFTSAEYTDDIRSKMKSGSASVKTARLRIPETILAVDMPLSEILLRWSTIPDDNIFLKNNVEREVALSRDLEQISKDKLLIYRFVTIPFNEVRKELYDFWYGLFINEINDRRSAAYTYAKSIRAEGEELEDLERAYRKCDIMYFYFDRFGEKEDLETIMELKHEISAKIMAILSR